MSPWSCQMTRLLQASGGRGSCLLTLTVLTQAEPGAVGGREKRRPAVRYPQGLRGPAGHWGEGPSDPPRPSLRAQYPTPQDPTVLLCPSTCLTERGGDSERYPPSPVSRDTPDEDAAGTSPTPVSSLAGRPDTTPVVPVRRTDVTSASRPH